MIFRKLLSKSFVSAISLLQTLILGLLGNYVWLPFRTGNGDRIIRKFNFLSITIVGYGFILPPNGYDYNAKSIFTFHREAAYIFHEN